MADAPRILFAIPELGWGGPDRVFSTLIGGLDRAAFRPALLVSRAGGRYFDALPDDVDVSILGDGRYPVWRFARAIDRLQPDLIVTTLRMNTTASAARALQRHRPPLVTRQANAIRTNFKELRKRSPLRYALAEWLVRRLLKTADALVAQSADMAAELERYASPRQRIAVIGNPVTVDDPKTAHLAEPKGKAASEPFGSPALVAVGRLAPQKGFDILIAAFSTLRRNYPQAGLTILGDGPERKALEAEIKRLGMEHAVRLPGHSENVSAEIEAADIFVSSSRYEGFSNALLEAMALGKPVVATDCEGGTRDMVIDGKTGILARPESIDGLTEAVLRTLSSDLSSLGKSGRDHVAARFSDRRIIAEYEDLFRELMRPELKARHHRFCRDRSS